MIVVKSYGHLKPEAPNATRFAPGDLEISLFSIRAFGAEVKIDMRLMHCV